MALIQYKNPLSSDLPTGDQSPFGASYYTPPTSPIAPTRPQTMTTGVTTQRSTINPTAAPGEPGSGGDHTTPPPDATPRPTPPPTQPGGIWGAGPRPSTGRIKYGPNGQYWDPNDSGADQLTEGSGGAMGGTAAPTTAAKPAGTSIFDDPATKNFETLLNQRIQELLGPAYTNSQMDLMQTQALDPLEVQRQQAKQQVIQRMASHGVPPSSGIVERALEDVDRQFNTLRTQSQSGFANKAIDQTATNHNQAVSMAEIIPQMAWSRLTGANGAVSPMNSPALLSLLNSFQQSGYQNSNQFMQSLIPILMQLFQ